MEWQRSIVVSMSAVEEKGTRSRTSSKEEGENACDNTTPDLSISRLQFIHPGRSERAKQSQSLLAAVMFLWQMDSLH